MTIQSYLFFDGRAEEAIEFYRRVLGAEQGMIMRFRDSPDPVPEDMLPTGSEDKIMHAELRLGDATLMLSDGRCRMQSSFQGFSLALGLPTAAEAKRLFEAMREAGGEVQMPFGKTFWSEGFGMVADPFGVSWMFSAA